MITELVLTFFAFIALVAAALVGNLLAAICGLILIATALVLEWIRFYGEAFLKLAERMERNQILADVAQQKLIAGPKPVPPKLPDVAPPMPVSVTDPMFDFPVESTAVRSGGRRQRS